MGGKKAAVPDAWDDDDWEAQADKVEEGTSDSVAEEQQPAKVTKAQRLARHAEANKQIWDSAETPETFHFLAARDEVPLKTEFKPTLKVLSRKPPPKIIARHDPVTGLSEMSIEDEEDEEDAANKNQPTAEERRRRAQQEREEKQKKYDEVRARLFGTSAPGSGSTTPGDITPPSALDDSRSSKGKNRARGGNREKRTTQSGTRELFDPNSTSTPVNVSIQKHNLETAGIGRSMFKEEERIVRTPRGPDSTGGSGFAKRGGFSG